jgi:hypothetical protein
MVRLHSALICALATLPLAGCYGLYGHDEGERYSQRMDTITSSAGDAKEVNARTHMNQAWPQGVSNRKIPMEGTRAVRAMDCYRQGSGQQAISDERGRAPAQNNVAVGGGSGTGGSGGGASAGGGGTQLKC